MKRFLHTFDRLIEKIYLKKILGRSFVIAVPYGWHILFFLIPFFIVMRISFSEGLFAKPPYTPIFEWVDDVTMQFRFNLSSYQALFEDNLSENLYIASYFQSIMVAGLSTIACLLIGYPIAYGIARVSISWRVPLLMMIILPFWTSFLIRVYAWVGILNNKGIINTLLMNLGIINEPLSLINNTFSVSVGIVYSYLPFVILPLYATLEKLNPMFLEAAYDLGCKPFKAFLTITLPLSMRGIMAGGMLVLIPSIGEFVIPELLGGSDSLMIGKTLWSEFFLNRDWPLAAALAVAMLILLVLPIALFQRVLKEPSDK